MLTKKLENKRVVELNEESLNKSYIKLRDKDYVDKLDIDDLEIMFSFFSLQSRDQRVSEILNKEFTVYYSDGSTDTHNGFMARVNLIGDEELNKMCKCFEWEFSNE